MQYTKDECPSLFKDPEQIEADALQNSFDRKPSLMSSKVHIFGFTCTCNFTVPVSSHKQPLATATPAIAGEQLDNGVHCIFCS